LSSQLPTFLIYTDGACSGNPGPGGWGSIVYSPTNDKVIELCDRELNTTNNRMEIIAALRALEFVARSSRELHSIKIYTDSTYLIRGATEWIFGWRRRGWKSSSGQDVANQDLWIDLSEILTKIKTTAKVEWLYVRGHMGTAGNERCDQLAVAMSRSEEIYPYEGPRSEYHFDILTPPPVEKLPEMKSNSEPKKAAHSYLSFVNGKVSRHSSWPECEAQTKGRSGAKFKKAMSASEEIEILKTWGLSADRLPK
jgi:ribonuclease HI